MVAELIPSAPVRHGELTPQERRHLGALERRISTGLTTFREVGAALLEIRENRLYRDTHNNFDTYCTERWALNRARAYQFIDASRVLSVLGDPKGITNEAQARVLRAVVVDNPEEAKRIWATVEKKSEEEKKPVTARMIREAMHPGAAATVTETFTDRLVRDMARLGSAYKRWAATRPGRAEVKAMNEAKAALVATLLPSSQS